MPKPEVSWWKDGQPIQPGDGLYFENKDGGDVYELVIEDTVPEDAGIYQVKAFNEGTSWGRVTVTIVGDICY